MDLPLAIYLETTRGFGTCVAITQMMNTIPAISASANNAASKKRIRVRGRILSGALQRRITRYKADGAPISTGQNRSAGSVATASAIVSYMVRRVSSVSSLFDDTPDWKHAGHQ